jgi:acetylornithine/succinyldiaminopimelate/putrescine aminotransferase
VFDEIQTGMGRLGTLWAYQSSGIEPDIMALAKALGGGIPFGAVLVREKIAFCLKVGDHGNTTGGSPLAAKLGSIVLKELLKPDFLQQVRSSAELLKEHLLRLKIQFPQYIEEVRGMGMLQGVMLKIDVQKVVAACRHKGLLVCKAGKDVLRLLPPLTTKEAIIRRAISILKKVFKTGGFE